MAWKWHLGWALGRLSRPCCFAFSSMRSRISRNLEMETSRHRRKAVSLEAWHFRAQKQCETGLLLALHAFAHLLDHRILIADATSLQDGGDILENAPALEMPRALAVGDSLPPRTAILTVRS